MTSNLRPKPTQPGQRYGGLVAVKLIASKPGITTWVARCDCGKIIEIAGRLLTQGRKTSCGCHPETYTGTRYKPGDKINRLTTVSYSNGEWLCRCECGKFTTVDTRRLASGNTQSCGCLHSEISREIVKSVHESNRKLEPNLATAKQRWNHYNQLHDPFPSFNEYLVFATANCTYCGIEPCQLFNAFAKKKHASNFSRENGNWLHNGIDRVDSDLPYILSNCTTACFTCNSAKSDQTVQEFLGRVPRYQIQPFIPLMWQTKEVPSGSLGLSIWIAYKGCYRDGDISLEEFYWASELPCFYCGDERQGSCNHAAYDFKSSNHAKTTGTFLFNGLDRIDPAKGHFKDNVVPCCKCCNWAKLNLSLSEFQDWIRRIQTFQSNTNTIPTQSS